MSGAVQSDRFQVLADRVHRYAYPIDRLFTTLTDERASWLRLAPGEVDPRILEAVPLGRVVWSSFWPVSPNDRIELDLSRAGPGYPLLGHLSRGKGRDQQTLLRMRWLSDSPPDARGIGITRQRLNLKFGGDLRGVVSDYFWHG